MNRTSIAISFFVIGLLPDYSTAQTFVFDNAPYLSFEDSPFRDVNNIVLEDFEDGIFNIAGVSAVSNTPATSLGVLGPDDFRDSVDGDDNSIDGFGRGGHSLTEINNNSTGNLGYTFSFDSSVLGALPTHVGIVWTDGTPNSSTQVEFFGAGSVSLGVLGPFTIGDGSFAGETAEDRFFGAIFNGGIESFTIRSPGSSNNLEVDHLQFTAVPEPNSLILTGAVTLGLITRRRRRIPRFRHSF